MFALQLGGGEVSKPMNCFSYIRVSGKAQVDKDGPDRQRASIAAFASKNDYQITEEFFDGGVSGSVEGVDREALNSLFTAIRANGVRTVLVERSDRLARDLMVGELIYAEFRKLGVRVIETEGGTELTVEDNEPTKVLIRQILGAVAQFEKAIIVQKLNAGRRRKAKETGQCCGGPGRFGEKPEEKLVIEQIQQMKSRGDSIAAIVRALNEQNAPTRIEGSRWHRTSVIRVLERG